MVKAYLETFRRYQYLLGNLISRDLKIKYRRSILGLLWSLLNPILMMLILSAVFSKVFGGKSENFMLYLITGQTLFSFFNEATSSALESIVQSSALMKKIYVPKYVFPLEKVLYAFVNLMFSMTAVIIITIFSGSAFHPTMLLSFLPLIFLLMFSTGFGLLLSALYAFFRDIKHLYSVIILAWMYLTPIIYEISFVEGTFIEPIVKINPLTWYITAFRNMFLDGTFPSSTTNLICLAYSVGMLLFGLLIFKKTQDKFVLHI